MRTQCRGRTFCAVAALATAFLLPGCDLLSGATASTTLTTATGGTALNQSGFSSPFDAVAAAIQGVRAGQSQTTGDSSTSTDSGTYAASDSSATTSSGS